MTYRVVITGASAGVGRAAARRFAADGARIGLIARDGARLERAADEVEEIGGAAVVLPCDVADADAIDAAADTFAATFGPPDIWVNNAMVTVMAPADEITPEEYRRVTEVTYLGVVHGTLAALRHMRPQNRGTIVQVGSALAYRSIPLQAPYCAAKHAVVGFTDSVRSELIHDGSAINLTVVHLPAVNTPQFDWARSRMPQKLQPVPPIFQPEVAADAIRFAALRPRRELWVGRSSAMAILGQTVAPDYLDRKLAEEGYGGQQTGEPAADRPDNLFDPVPGDVGAHGRFDDRAETTSPQLEFAKHRNIALFGAALAIGVLVPTVARALADRRQA